MLTDYPLILKITGGEVHDCKVAPEFIEKLPFSEYTIADKGYDSEEVRDIIRKKSSIPVIQEKAILRLVIRIWIGVFINTGIWLKICLPE